MSRSVLVDADVSLLAPGGDGVAHVVLEGRRRAIFAPRTAPGDRVRLRADVSRSPARGQLVELLVPGPDRVSAACPWFEACGGCDWMHVSQRAQQAAHVEHLRAALPADWSSVPIASMVVQAPLGYRTRARVHVRCARRGEVIVGMYASGSHEPVAVDACAVLDPRLELARAALAALLDGSRGRGDVHLALGSRGLPVLSVDWTGTVAPAVFGRLEQDVDRGKLAGAELTLDGASRPATIGDPTPWMAGADDQPLRLAKGGFGQASETGNRSLAKHVAELVAPLGVETVVELYSGAGNLSVVLAPLVRELVCVETDEASCAAARANLADRGADRGRARVVCSDVDAYRWPAATKLVVLDPPRTGARAVASRLAESHVRHVVYVSCDAQTLGRDLAVLSATYRLRSATVFEMFPQTSHAEIVIALERRKQ